MRLGDSILDQPLIRAHYTADNSPVVHESLRVRAENVHIKARETVDEYVETHLDLRQVMMQEGYPQIQAEATTVAFIIRGLYSRHSSRRMYRRSC